MIIAIDPGKKGGIAYLDCESEFVRAMPMDEEGEYDYEYLKIHLRAADVVVIEAVTRPAKLVRNAAIIQGICIGAGIPYELVRPQVWRNEMGIEDGTGKLGVMEKLRDLRPDLYEMAEMETRAGARPHDGMVDSAAIGLWYLRRLEGGNDSGSDS